MIVESFDNDITYTANKVKTKVILQTAYSKEIRIVLGKDAMMKEHKAPYPIIIHVLSGAIDFGCDGSQYALGAGDIITLGADVPHDLQALQDSVVRLSLSKMDRVGRVDQVVSGT